MDSDDWIHVLKRRILVRMRYLFFLCCYLATANLLFSQKEAGDKPSPYLFPEFQEGTLFYRSTTPQTAALNYHKISQEMVMKLREHMVPINDIETVDSIHLDAATFVRIDDRFYEQLAAAEMQLLVQHRSTSQEATKTGAYGQTAHTGGVEVHGAIEKRIEFYALHWEDHKNIIDRTEYWVKDGDKWHKANNFKQLANIFTDKKKQLKTFVSENKLRLDRPADLARAFKFCVGI